MYVIYVVNMIVFAFFCLCGAVLVFFFCFCETNAGGELKIA